MTVSRKDFMKAALASSALALLHACGEDEPSGTPGSSSSASSSGTGGVGSSAGGADGGGGTAAEGGRGGGGRGGSGGDGGEGGGAGGAGGTGGRASGKCQEGTEVTIVANHGHELVVSKEDVAAGVDKTYDITGLATTHMHEVIITAADFAALQAGDSIALTSTTGGGHMHTIAVSCA